jgi:hypothetical protein
MLKVCIKQFSDNVTDLIKALPSNSTVNKHTRGQQYSRSVFYVIRVTKVLLLLGNETVNTPSTIHQVFSMRSVPSLYKKPWRLSKECERERECVNVVG